MTLEHDSAGFLTGEVVADIRRANNTLTAIRSDIAAIKRAVINSGNQSRSGGASGPNLNSRSSRSRSTENSGSGSASPRPRPRRSGASGSTGPVSDDGSSPNLGGGASPRRRRSTGQTGGENPPILPPTANGEADNTDSPSILPGGGESARPRPRRRAAAGGGGLRERDDRGRFTSNDEGDQSDEERRQRRLFDGLGDRLADAVTGTAGNLEEIDPNIKAFNEIAQPLARGYQLFMGGNKEDRWYRRIFGELRLFRTGQTAFNRAEQRTLNEIDGNTENTGGGASGGPSFLGGLLGGIAPAIMAALAGIGGTLLTGITSVLGVVFGPIGLAIGVASAAAWGLFTEDGRKFFAGVADKIYAGWQEITSYLQGKWDEGVKLFTDIWAPIGKFFSDKFGIVSDTVKSVAGKVSDTAQKANDFVKDKTGIDVKEGVKSAYEGAKNVARENVVEPAKKAFGSAKDWVLGKTSQLFESGKGGAGTVSSGKGDFGGASYGTYQLSSKQGTLQNFLKSSGYGSQFEGLTPGTKEFNQKWKEVAKNDSAFGSAQHEFIKNTHFDPQVDRLKKAGIDIEGRGKSVQDAVWSTSVQFGGQTGLIEKALKGKDAAKLSDAEFVSALQDYKIANNDRLFSKSSSQVRAGTLNRAQNEKSQLLNLASVENGSNASLQTPSNKIASIPAPVPMSMPTPQAIADAPPIITPMVSESTRKSMSIKIDKGDVGQDISDRRLAHIITGGLSG